VSDIADNALLYLRSIAQTSDKEMKAIQIAYAQVLALLDLADALRSRP
jgi:hypothetical protein